MNGVLRLLRNISSNYVKVAVNATVLILLTPYIIHQLGEPAYAVWIIVLTLGYYLNFLDLGVADAQVQRHSVLSAQGATTELGRLHGTALTLFLGAGVTAFFLSLLLVALPTADLFDIPAENRETYQLLLPLIGLSVLFSFSELGINGLFEGYQRYDLMNAIDIVLTVIDALAMAAALFLGYGLIGLALVKVTMDGVGAAAKAVVARKTFPAYAFPKIGFDIDAWKSIRGFSLWNSLNDLLTEGTANLDKLLIPILLTTALLTPYSLTVTLTAVVLVVAEPITETFFPIVARRHGKSDVAALGVLLSRGSKLVNLVTLPTLLVVLCFGEKVLDLWVGEQYTDIAPAVLWLMALNFYFSTYLWTAISVLAGSGHVRMLFWASLIEVVMTLVLIVVLTPAFGLPGLVFAGLVANVVTGVGFFILRACHLTGTPFWPFLLKTLLLPIATSLPSFALGLWLLQRVQPEGWLETGACIIVTGLAGLLSLFLALTGRWERLRYQAVLRQILAFGRTP